MRSISKLAATALAASAALLAAAPAGAAERARPTGRWLVVLEDAGSARSASALARVLARTGARRAGSGVPALGVVTVEGAARAIARLRRDPAVRSVSREHLRPLRRVPNDPALWVSESGWPGVPPATAVQWPLRRQGFPRAWDVARGHGARVAVVDSGVDGSHPDLGSKVATADSINGAGNPRSDEDGHGTHVAGLACAATDNGRGVAGAGWACRLNVVKMKVVVGVGAVPDEDIVDGIVRAANRRPHAINMSFGGGPESEAINDALRYALRRGIVLVAAASNSTEDNQGPPASFLQPGDAPNLHAGRGLVVTAAEFDGDRAGTGYGSQISLAAHGFFDRCDSQSCDGPPGVISTYPGASVGCPPGAVFGCRRSFGGDDRYAYVEGTSMATPQVTALAALVADLNPFLSLREKLVVIKRSARGFGWDPNLGWGIIDAGATIAAARRVDHLAPASRARARVRRRGRRSALVRVRWSGRDPAGRAGLIASGVRSYDVYLKRGRGRYRRVRRGTRRRSALLRLRPGVYRVYTRARDRAGNRERAPRRADVRIRVKRRR